MDYPYKVTNVVNCVLKVGDGGGWKQKGEFGDFCKGREEELGWL